MIAPAVLVAARTRFLNSDEFAFLSASNTIGSGYRGSPTTPWVFVGTDPDDGLPWAFGPDQAAVSFYLRSGSWTTGNTSARFPILGATVWVEGNARTNDAPYLAREVTEQVITVFDDYSNEAPKQWSSEVWAISSRWDGSLSVSDVEAMPTLYRADVAFELEIA